MTSPIAIGGVGGSGTRIVASFLDKAGIHMGQQLNGANDNLWFTFLFKRPHWFADFPEAAEIHTAIALFEKATTVGLHGRATDAEKALLLKIAAELNSTTRAIGVNAHCAQRLLASEGSPASLDSGWGWKEPNTHVFLPELADFWPEFRYIHVLRHGLDMAFSRNIQQACNWSKALFGTPVDADSATAGQILEYWIAANHRAISQGQALLGSRFFLLSYEALCDHPEREIQRLFEFVGRPVPKTVSPDQIRPRSRKRYLEQDLSQFSPAQKTETEGIMALAEIG